LRQSHLHRGEANREGGYALIQDLKSRGLLDDTIVLWCGEFGRTPMSQGSKSFDSYGRDHHMKAFAGWLSATKTSPLQRDSGAPSPIRLAVSTAVFNSKTLFGVSDRRAMANSPTRWSWTTCADLDDKIIFRQTSRAMPLDCRG
jgi:hypothetical protein